MPNSDEIFNQLKIILGFSLCLHLQKKDQNLSTFITNNLCHANKTSWCLTLSLHCESGFAQAAKCTPWTKSSSIAEQV